MREEGSEDVILEIVGKYVSINDQESYHLGHLFRKLTPPGIAHRQFGRDFVYVRGMMRCIKYRHSLLC